MLTLTLTLALTSSMGVWKLCVLASAAVLSAGFSSLIQPVSTWLGLGVGVGVGLGLGFGFGFGLGLGSG